MNIEVQTAEIKTNESYTFTFSKPVQQYMVGFSKCIIEYKRPDHHVKHISIDLVNSRKNNRDVIIQPQLKMHDTSNHKESPNSIIAVVVIATVGDGNPNVHLITTVKPFFKNKLPANEVTFLKSSLIFASVEYPGADHHLYQYSSSIDTLVKPDSFIIRGQSILRDHGNNSGEGQIMGSVIAYTGSDQSVLSCDFNSQQIGESGPVCLGDVQEGLQYQNYQVVCFVTGFDLSYNKNVDHHILKIEVSAKLCVNKLDLNNGKVFAKVDLKSYLVDNGENPFNIPHNSISGFVVAFNNRGIQ